MKKWKKIFALIISTTFLVSALAACAPGDKTSTTEPATSKTDSSKASEASKTESEGTEAASSKDDNGSAVDPGSITIGVSMPTKSLQRWNQDGANMKSELEAAGFKVDLQYANDKVADQVSQIENMITTGCNVLVVAAIDGSSLGTVLADAKDMDIPVIAYDRLIMNTDAVSYYATFDNYQVGVIQAEYIKKSLDLENTSETFNMEMFGGSPDDNNANFFFGGAYDTLKPFIDEGKLNILSKQTDFATIATADWKTQNAQARMDNLLTAYYSKGEALDVVLSPNDSVALGIANSLEQMEYTPGEDWPILTGQDCDIANVKNIIAGKQSMSVFKDTRALASKVVEMVTAIVNGEDPEVNDTETYDNGISVIPTYLLDPIFADVNNYKELLIDSGYYKESDLA